MKQNRFSVFVVGLVLLSGMSFSQQQTINYENFPKAKMMLVGIPLNFEDNDPGSVLGPVFGTGDSVGEWWRFSRWNIANQTYFRYGEAEYTWNHENQAYTSDKTEQGSPRDIEPGYGYWLAQSVANTVRDFSLTGTPVDQQSPVYVTVDAPATVQGHSYPGITMVSNPFLYSVDWANAGFRVNDSQELTLAQAVNMGLVSQYAYPWNGDQYTPFNMTDGGVLNVWDGYWVEQLNPEQTEYIVYNVVKEIEGSEGGGDDCGTCPDDDLGQLRWLQLRYDGDQAAYIEVYDNRWWRLYGNTVQPGGVFDFYGLQNRQAMGPKILVYVYYWNKCVCPNSYVEIHTSCSVPIGPGQVWGLFTVMAGENKDGITLCPIGETNQPIVKFYNATSNGSEAKLGDGGAIETDRFIVSMVDSDNDELAFKTYTVNNDSSDWTALTEVGTNVSDGLGFTVTLISEDGDDYTVDVASTGSQSSALSAVKFRFGDDQTIDSPNGETFTSTRSLLNGVQVTSLELKTPAINAGAKLAKSNPTHPVKAEAESEWIVPISVTSTSGSLIDSYNGFGVIEGASAMYDPMDARNYSPNLDAWVDIYFPHHEVNNPLDYWPQNPMKVAYDVRPSAEVIAWDMSFSYVYVPNQKFTISWDAGQFPENMDLTLVDFQNDQRTDMLSVSEYSVTTPSDDYGTLYYVIVAAPQELVGIDNGDDLPNPAEYRLLANYPNPFNATTTLQYNLPEAARVQLNIYNLNGTLVKTLVDDVKPAGHYGMVWDGRDQSGKIVGTGVYIYRFQANDYHSVRKMVLIK